MRILIVHNRYAAYSGEERAIENQVALLRAHRHDVRVFERSSERLRDSLSGHLKAFYSALYSRSSRRAIGRVIAQFAPDVVHVHNIYPLVSPSVLLECSARAIPIVMTLHNYRLLCPTGLLFSKGRACQRCVGGREVWCAVNNCADSWPKSAAYALRAWIWRRFRFDGYVDRFVCLTNLQKQQLAVRPTLEPRCEVIPSYPSATFYPQQTSFAERDYVAFAGRTVEGKGIGTLLAAARLTPNVRFKLAGTIEGALGHALPPNVEHVGPLPVEAMRGFYVRSRFVVFPSIFQEVLPLVPLEAHACARPVVASRVGAVGEIVRDGLTGMLFEPGNAHELARHVRQLWEDWRLCEQLGRQARQHVVENFAAAVHYQRLLSLYSSVRAKPTI